MLAVVPVFWQWLGVCLCGGGDCVVWVCFLLRAVVRFCAIVVLFLVRPLRCCCGMVGCAACGGCGRATRDGGEDVSTMVAPLWRQWRSCGHR